MAQDWILAGDIGTSSVKTALFLMDGTLVDSVAHAHATRFAHPGWADQDAGAWWRGFCLSVRELVVRHPEARQRIGAIGVSGQMLGCLAIDAKGEPLHPHLIHSDTRSSAQATHIARTIGAAALYRRTGNILDARAGLSKLLWLKENASDAYRDADLFVQAKDFIVGRLTGHFDTSDWSEGGHALFMDVNTRTYMTDLFADLGLDAARMPTLRNGTDVVGTVCAEAAKALDLPAGIPVVAGAGDGPCAGVGAGSSLAGDAYACMGTTAWISYTSDRPVFDPGARLFTIISPDGRTCGVYGTTQSAGRSVTWAMDLFGDHDVRAFDEKAARIPAGSGGLLFLPYLDGERTPIYDTEARGVFFGMSAAHGPDHFRRAVLEGVALALRDIVTVFRESVPLGAMRLIGGGAKSELWRGIIASACGLSVQRLRTPASDATSLGAALTAAVGVGMHEDLASAQRAMSLLDAREPVAADAAVYDRMYPLYAALYAANRPLFGQLAALRDVQA